MCSCKEHGCGRRKCSSSYFYQGPLTPFPSFEIAPKLKETGTEKLRCAQLFFWLEDIRVWVCVGFLSTVLGIQVEGDTKGNQTFTA